MRCPYSKDCRGTTLLDILAAVGLFAIVAVMAALNYKAMLATWRLKAATRQVVVDLKAARLQAIAEGVSHRLCFDPGASFYFQQRKEPRSYENEGPPTSLPPGITVEDCTARYDSVSFQPRGHAGSFGTITLTNHRGQRRQVVVDMVGRVRIQ